MSSILSDAPKYAYPDQYKDANSVWFKNNTQQVVAVTISRDQGLYGDDSPHPLQAGETASWGRTHDNTFNYTISAMQNGFPVQPPIMTGTCARGIVYTYNGQNNVTAPPHPSTSAYTNEGMRLLDQWSDDPSTSGIYANTAEFDLAFKNWLINGGWKNTSTSSTSAVPIVEGQDYFLVSPYDNRTLNVTGGSQDNNASIIMWNKELAANSLFRFVSDGNGYYYITAKHSGKIVAARGTENNTSVVQYDKQGLDNATLDRFRWKIQPNGDGSFGLILKAGGRALTIGNGSGNGAPMVIWDNSSGSNQLWRFEAATTATASPVVEGQDYFLVSPYDNRTLNVTGGSQDNNASIIMWNKELAANSLFRFVSDGNGYYYITAKHSGKVVAARGTENNTSVVQYDKQGLDNATLDRFRWKIQPNGDGSFGLILKAGGRVLTIGDGSGNGAPMVIWDNSSGSHQLWRFEAA